VRGLLGFYFYYCIRYTLCGEGPIVCEDDTRSQVLVSLGRYQKLGNLFYVEETGVWELRM